MDQSTTSTIHAQTKHFGHYCHAVSWMPTIQRQTANKKCKQIKGDAVKHTASQEKGRLKYEMNMPKYMNWTKTRSTTPQCKHKLKHFVRIPLLINPDN